MNDNVTLTKVFVSGLIAAGTAIWGWFGWLTIVWVGCMALDYLSGSLAAMKHGEWNSPRAREGLWHKAGMILAVAVAAIADIALGLILHAGFVHLPFDYTVLLSPLVMGWYILTELGSVAENAVRMGAVVPGWLRKILKISADAVDKTGEKLTGGDDHDGA